jgi:hypothetical protein
MECMSLLGFGACAPDPEFRASLPFPSVDIDRDAIPPLLRRRSSQAMQMAFSAATLACKQAQRSPETLASVFASVAGEIQTTDLLCTELVKPDGVISPSVFHNSVQNTVAGYWTISQHCIQPASALAAGYDTFAMALLEAWCQLTSLGGELLLVCYDENWPKYLAPGQGEPAFACSMVLSAGAVKGSLLQIGRPHLGADIFPADWKSLVASMPVLAAIPLLGLAATGGEIQNIPVSSVASGWQVKISPVSIMPDSS